MRELTEMERVAIGDRLRRVRHQAGLSVRELAERASIDKMSVVNVEKGKKFREATLLRICKSLGVNVESLIGSKSSSSRPYNIHRNGNNSWFELTDPDKTVFYEGELSGSKIDEYGVKVPASLLDSRLEGGKVESAIILVAEQSPTRNHQGEEFVWVLSGTAQITIGEETVILHEGESIAFWSGEPHSYAPAPNTSCTPRILSVTVNM